MSKTFSLSCLIDKFRANHFVYCPCCHGGDFNCKNFDDHMLWLKFWTRNPDPVKNQKSPAKLE